MTAAGTPGTPMVRGAARRPRRAALVAVALALAGVGGCGLIRPDADAPYVSTPDNVVRAMLELAEVKPGDVVYDLGSGDGRIIIMAAREFGARGVGIEIDPQLVAHSRRRAQQLGIADRVEFVQQDLFLVDVSPATVLTLYLGQELNLRLRPRLVRELRPGSRIVSHDFGMGDWPPLRAVRIESGDRSHNVLLWTVPPRSGQLDSAAGCRGQ
ncbi:MAG TPA: methyltransferase domain-containing protein [Candidatus Binatia bacterium]|nr:methyltransferase domain-containing protein [Candidatus Binatia bacterium]